MFPTFLRPRMPGFRPLIVDVLLAAVLCAFVGASARWWAGPHMFAAGGPPPFGTFSPQPALYPLIWLATLPV
ncbi:MAG: hypothetical protein J2P44_14820, partial [Candidatus Dormibacteraeota bacterium]|nr:hypothetical protein [Candidatus Dormibacteraeota bacterium]